MTARQLLDRKLTAPDTDRSARQPVIPKRWVECPGVFAGTVLFGSPDEWTADQLRRCMGEVRLQRGRHLFREGADGEGLYVIVDGRIKLSRDSTRGRSIILSLLGPGHMLGESTIFDEEPSFSTATAMTDSRLFALSKRDLDTLLHRRPDLALSLLKKLSRRVRHSNDLLADLVFSDTAGRVAKVLLDLSTRFGAAHEDGLHVRHDLTQLELSELVGSSRETVNKTLADFANRGWLRVEPRGLIVCDLDRLRSRAERCAGNLPRSIA